MSIDSKTDDNQTQDSLTDNGKIQESCSDYTFKKLSDITRIGSNVFDDYDIRNE